ncbi:MAG: hypothetical protein ABSF18_02700 [Gammaproteobacteria bacterium]
MGRKNKQHKKIEVPTSSQKPAHSSAVLQVPQTHPIPYNNTSAQRAVFVMPATHAGSPKKLKTNNGHNANLATPESRQKKPFFTTAFNSTEPDSQFKQTVLNALKKEILRLKGKLEGFFSWFTWNKALVQAKVEKLEKIEAVVKISNNDDQISAIANEIIENKSCATTYLTTNYYDVLKQHRIFNYNDKTDTQINLSEAIKDIRPQPR